MSWKEVEIQNECWGGVKKGEAIYVMVKWRNRMKNRRPMFTCRAFPTVRELADFVHQKRIAITPYGEFRKV